MSATWNVVNYTISYIWNGGTIDTQYTVMHKYTVESADITLVPYFAWGNRGVGEMRVWLPTARAEG